MLLGSVAFAGPARERLDAFANGLDALRGTFTQEVFDADGRSTETSKGSVALKAPRQFRWEYEAPFPQLIVADGSNVWVWDKDLDQVTVRNQSAEESQSPLTVLTDLSLLEREYTLRESGERDGFQWLELKPKAEEAPFERCELGLAADGLARMVLHDTLGQRNELRFARWERNPALDATLFAFTPPEGVDVVGKPVESAEAIPIKD
jgi:outer membrane lipoprotein carrier protein